MSSHQRNHTAVIRWLLFVCLLYSGSSLEAQIEAPTPVPTQEAPSKSNRTSDDSELKIQSYQLKHAKPAEVLMLFKQLHGIVNGVTVDERTNSIVFFANDDAARELRESLVLLDSDAPHPIIPPAPVLKGSSPQAPVPAKSQPRPEKSKPAGPFRKYTFKHAKVADVVKILRELTGANIDNENVEGFAVDERTNSVIWKVRDEWESRHWEETLLTLDGESSTSKAQKTPSPYRSSDDNLSDGVSLSYQTLTISLEVDRSNTVESLKQRYNELEQQAHQLADKLKQSKSPSEPERTELKTAVRTSFEARQTLQRAELADLAQRMKSMQQSIDMRDKLADKVVQRRVEDLLNPNLTWDTTPSQEPKSQAADEPKISISTSPSLSSIQAAVTRLLTRLPHFKTPQGDVDTAPIAFLGIDYQGPYSLADFRDELQKEIEAQISQSSSCSLVSRRMTEVAMAETRVKPTDMVSPLVLKKLTQSLRSMDMKVQGLMFARLKHLGDSDSTQNGEFEVSLELFDVNLQSYKERATARNDRSSSKSREREPQLLQGRWIIESWSRELEDQLSNAEKQIELRIDGPAIHVFDDVGNQYSSMLLDEQNIEPAAYNGIACPVNYVIDPNGDRIVCPGILELDGERLRICYSRNSLKGADPDKFRPSLFIPGSKVTLIECRRAPTDAAKAAASNEVDLSTPQATLDTIHRYSVDHPMGVQVECFTEPALQELSGVMLQQLSFMSGLSQIGLQTGGVIGVKDNVPMVAGTAPSFHLSVDALLKEHSLPTPPEECTKAFELLAKLTLGAAFGSDESLVKPDRELFRLASGILKSPKDFLPKAAELSERFNDIPGDTDSPRKESKAQPKYLIEIDGDQAIATQIVDSDKPSVPMSFKLQRINQRWLVSQAFSDEILDQMISSMSLVLDGVSASGSEVANQRDSSDSKKAPDAEGANNTSPREWDDFLKLLPETGTALVMFSYEPEIKEQMLPVAKKVAEAASVQLIELPQTTWHKIIAPPATHFVLMKDRQLVGTRTGLMTEARLQDFVAKAKDWLTPQSTGIAENSLVRIDCFINPGTDNIGSQHGGAYPMTTAVVAVHEDRALLFGSESIAEYIEKGYACVAIVRDAAGNQKQVPMDVLLKGPVKLVGRSEKQPKSAASMNVTFGDGTSREVPLPGVASIYPKSVTELLEAYDVGSAIYHIRGVQGLKPVRLAAIKDAPIVNQRVLSGSFRRERHVPPLHGFRSPIDWQSQTVPKADGHIYGDNINGAEMFEVLCPTRPAPCGFTFNEHGRLIGKYGLGSPTEKDMTHTVFKPDTTHSVLQAALEKISDAGLKAALAQTLEESSESLKTSMKVPSDAGETDKLLYSGHPISWWLEKYWQNAMATPKTNDNETEEFVATIAIRKLCEMPECDSVIETELSKWYTSVEHEVNEGQLTRAAKCIVTAADPAHQETAVKLLFKIWKRMPLLTYEEQGKMAVDHTELNQLLSQLVLNDQLAAQFADRLTNGDSSDRSLVLYGLLSLMGRFGVETNKDLTELENWLRQHAERLAPAVEAASHDANEQIRFTALIQLATLFHVTKLDPEFVRLPKILLTAASDASPNVRYIAIELLTSNELAPAVKSRNIEIAPLMIKTLESDSSVDVRYAALGALMAMDKDSELVHATLLEWARCKERLQVEYALSLMLRNHEAGDRPQSIDELIELLSDPEWGTKVEVNYNNWSTHHRWARQYAIAILGQYAAHAHRAIPTLEAELAGNNKDTRSFANEAIDRVRGYCPDLPIDKLQGEWEFVSLQKPESSSPFFDFQASSDQQPSSLVTISGTQLKLGERVLAELSHYRSGSRQGVALLLDPDGKKRHCHGWYKSEGGQTQETPLTLTLEVSELHDDPSATHATKQSFEFRPVKE